MLIIAIYIVSSNKTIDEVTHLDSIQTVPSEQKDKKIKEDKNEYNDEDEDEDCDSDYSDDEQSTYYAKISTVIQGKYNYYLMETQMVERDLTMVYHGTTDKLSSAVEAVAMLSVVHYNKYPRVYLGLSPGYHPLTKLKDVMPLIKNYTDTGADTPISNDILDANTRGLLLKFLFCGLVLTPDKEVILLSYKERSCWNDSELALLDK